MDISSMKIIILLTVLALAFCVEDLNFIVKVKIKNQSIIFSSNLTISLHSLDANPIHFSIPRSLISQAYLQVLLIDPVNSAELQAKQFKLTKKMFGAPQSYGLEKWFGIDNIVISNQINIEQLYSQNLYLKIASSDDQQSNKIAFTIDQSLILTYKSFKPLSKVNTPLIHFKLTPEFFQTAYLSNGRLLSRLGEYNQFFEVYFMRSRNKKIGPEDIRMVRQIDHFYREMTVQAIKQVKKQIKSEFTKQQLQLLHLQLLAIDQRAHISMLQQLISELSLNHILTLFKNVAINILFEFMQLAKNCIFFNYYDYYLFAIPIIILSTIISAVAEIAFLIALYNLFSHHQDHIGLTLMCCYIIIAVKLISALGSNEISNQSIFIIVVFCEPILKLQFQKKKVFPYIQAKTHRDYQHTNSYDPFIAMAISIIGFGLLIGNYFFFARPIKYSQQKSLDKFNTFQIIAILLNSYIYFFIILGQIIMNQQLKSVRHINKTFIVAYCILGLSDNCWALLYSEPFYILFLLKQDILGGILVWQCTKWGDLGEGSRKYYFQQCMRKQLLKREAQLAKIN